MVSAKIENELIKPITVSQTISSDIDIRTYIEGKTREEAESVKTKVYPKNWTNFKGKSQ